MYIEDLVCALALHCQINHFDSKIILSFYNQIVMNTGFTEKQQNLAVKILKKHSSKLNLLLSKDISQFLENPKYKLTKRTINYQRKISVIENERFFKVIKVEFPYEEKIVSEIRKDRTNLEYAAWDREEKAWIFSLHETNIIFCQMLHDKYEFHIDEEFESYITQIQEIKKNFDRYLPMVVLEENSLKFANVSGCVPQPDTENITESLFLARKVGINTWDDKIQEYLNRPETNKVTKDFLNSNISTDFTINLEEFSLKDTNELITHLSPTLFIIPGGNEFKKFLEILDFLKTMNVSNEEISVLFRLSNETCEDFNKFVKDNFLNNPLGEKTKYVFISSKLPKTILEANFKFNLVVTFSLYNVHYSIREFVKVHHNVVHILDKKPQRTLNFANL